MILQQMFGTAQNGEKVDSFTLENQNGTRVVLIEYGCAIQSFQVPVNGTQREIVLGFNTLAEYEKSNSSQGSFVGRVANRINNATFDLNGKTYNLSKNNGNNHLHGVLSKTIFTGSIENDTVIFKYNSPHLEDGFPGNMLLTITYSLAEDDSLTMDYKAVCDEDTIANLTNHSYFNLDGAGAGEIHGHTLWLNCKEFCESNSESCPTGKILPVASTPMDFTISKKIGQDINADYYQLEMANGYDHNFIINKKDGELALCAMAKSNDGEVVLEIFTTQPGVQLYTGNYLNETGKDNKRYSYQHAFCLETQHYPCSPSFAHFPTVVLKKGEILHEITIYKAHNLE